MQDLFFVHVPRQVVNDGGYIESADHMKRLILNDASLSTDLDETKEMNFQKLLQDVLTTDCKIGTIHWSPMLKGHMVQLQFTVPNTRSEFVLNTLASLGVGEQVGHVWVLPLDVCRPRPSKRRRTSVASNGKHTKNDRFIQSIKSRMVVEKVVETARASAVISFDYLALVVVASAISMLGLVYNNVVVIVASMLVSPIMGPVVAVTFGIIIKDWKLFRTGLVSEFVSLLICVGVGFIFGLIAVPFSSALNLPTPEMQSRGTMTGLVSGILVAIPSGIGVALSILGNNTSSLVGVAISASLLPPAVNTGILLAIAALSGHYHPDDMTSSEFASDVSGKAVLSFLITLANIVVIFIMALGMFKLKEVAPIAHKTRFWKEDVKMTRGYNAVLKGEAAQAYADQIRKIMPTLLEDSEFRNFSSEISSPGTVQTVNSLDHYLSLQSLYAETAAAPALMSIFDEPKEPELLPVVQSILDIRSENTE